jgi:hypothetical protein
VQPITATHGARGLPGYRPSDTEAYQTALRGAGDIPSVQKQYEAETQEIMAGTRRDYSPGLIQRVGR